MSRRLGDAEPAPIAKAIAAGRTGRIDPGTGDIELDDLAMLALQALIAFVLSGQASRSALLGFSVGMKLVLSVWTGVLGATALVVMVRTLRWRRAVADEGRSAAGPFR